MRLDDLREEVAVLQKDEEVKLYAPELLRQAENSLIQAVNAWNQGRRRESNELAEKTEQAIAALRKETAANKKLGLSPESWRQMRYLQEQREIKMKKAANNLL